MWISRIKQGFPYISQHIAIAHPSKSSACAQSGNSGSQGMMHVGGTAIRKQTAGYSCVNKDGIF